MTHSSEYRVEAALSSTFTNSATDDFTTNSNAAPVFASTSVEIVVDENTPGGTAIGQPVTATDADGDDITYSLSGVDASDFTIASTSGQISLAPTTTLDYETDSSYSLTVTATDSFSATGTAAVTVTVKDVYEGPYLIPDPSAAHLSIGQQTRYTIGGSTQNGQATLTETPDTGNIGLSISEAGLDETCHTQASTLTMATTGSLWIDTCSAGLVNLRIADASDASLHRGYALSVRKGVEALPISDDENPFVRRICWRFPGCPLSAIFLAPLIMIGVVLKAGGRHPALITLAGGGTFAGAIVLLNPNPFTFIIVGAVAAASFLLWRVVKV